ncbi:glucokinase [Defluviimonas sp. D31]|uniref:glucokinase n=1 Tax=Defluviimonas sp. D31 TaxID=3083253 RepID=UPI00296E9CAC|nr:glucokinase [Defluviimonas sp. D31]MDW4548746.1 glucokinase [Defluviimonas sp. D31]
MPQTLTLVADIGGTNTRVALAPDGIVDRASIRRFANADHPGLGPVLAAYLAAAGDPRCEGACVAVAGPVADGVATMTNLDWTIDRDAVADATGATRVAVINDLQAQGHALDHLAPGSLRPLIAAAGPRKPGAAQLVIGIGTGFNAAPVHETPAGRIVTASECGHMTIPVRSDADLRLMRCVETAHGFAGIEDVLSGRGLERLFAFHASEAGRDDRPAAAAIMAAIAEGADPVATATGASFVRLLGTVAGDLALSHLPFGGIHLIGGVARAFTAHYAGFGLAEAFRDKGRFSGFMQEFPVSIIEDDYAALEGCALCLGTTNSA